MRTLSLLVLALTACGGDDDDMAMAPCAEETRADDLAVGLAAGAPEDGLTATITAADPIPPEVGDNAWTVDLADGEGAALTGCDVSVVPFMPDHGHGSPADPTVDATDGTVQTTFELSMGGYWTVSFEADCGEGDVRTATFDICAGS